MRMTKKVRELRNVAADTVESTISIVNRLRALLPKEGDFMDLSALGDITVWDALGNETEFIGLLNSGKGIVLVGLDESGRRVEIVPTFSELYGLLCDIDSAFAEKGKA